MSEDIHPQDDNGNQNPPINPDFGPLDEGDQRPKDINPDFGPVDGEAEAVNVTLGEMAVEGQGEPDDTAPEPDQGSADDSRENDPDKAHVMGKAMDGVISLATKLEKTGDPSDAEFAKTLREKGDKLGQEAKEKYEAEQLAYQTAREYAIGRIVAVAKGEIEGNGIFLLGYSRNGEDQSEHGLTPLQIEKLRHEVYSALGVPEPSDEAFVEATKEERIDDRMISPYRDAIIYSESKETGLRLREARSYVKVGKLGRRELKQLHMNVSISGPKSSDMAQAA